MAKKDYSALADAIIEKVGGKANISYATHCMTRLRLNLKDRALANVDEIKNISGLLGAQWSGDQFQIIVGQDVPKLYAEVCNKTGLAMQEAINENLDGIGGQKEFSIKRMGYSILDTLSGSVVPLIPMVMAASLFKLFATMLGPNMFNVLEAGSDLYKLLTFVGDAGFYFFPIIIGYTAAKKMGVSPVLGMFMGAIMLHPTFMQMATEGVQFAVYGIPCKVQSYASSFLPIILSVWVMGYVEKGLNRVIPQTLKTTVVPFLTIAIMLPISLCVLGPLGSYAGTYLGTFLTTLDNLPVIGFLSVALVAAFWQFVIMTGMHLVVASTMILVFLQVGHEDIVTVGAYLAGISMAGVLFASTLKAKDKEEKSLNFGYFVAAILGGVTEPGLYGNILKYKKTAIGLILGGFAGGLYAGIMDVKTYTLVSVANFAGAARYAGGPTANFVNGCIACVIAFATAAMVTYFFCFKKEDTNN